MWNSGWNKIFEDNEWGKYPPEELVRFIARNFYQYKNKQDIKILEIGSGTGANIWFLAKEGFDVYGIDGSEIGIEKTKTRLNKENLKAKLYIGDVMKLPFRDNIFDGVIDNECIYANNYKDSKIIMNEVYRVLKPEGLFYSKTFMVGTYGYGEGKKLEEEKNTFYDIEEGGLRSGYGIVRYTDEEEINDLYGSKLKINSLDSLIRTDRNKKFTIKEWIIICQKGEKND